MYEIIDAHIHPYLTKKSNLGWFKHMSPDRFVDCMKKCGISKACGSVIIADPACDFDRIREMNTESLAFRDRYPDFFIPGMHVHPDYPEESCRELEILQKEEGVRWVGELTGYLTNFKTYISEGAFEIYAAAQELGLPINIHDFNIEEIDEIAEAFPKLAIIVAHPGDGLENMKKRVACVAKHRNVHMDISGHAPDRWGYLRYAIDTAGKDKFLFGSDFPICNPASAKAVVESEILTEEERKAVFSGNFKRIAGLQ